MMNNYTLGTEYTPNSLLDSHSSAHEVQSINSADIIARLESHEGIGKKGISDVRRTFCLFATFDFLFVTLLWIIELNVNGGILDALQKEVLKYDYYYSFFDIFITTLITCAFLLVKVILSKLFSTGAFGYVLPIMSFILAWIEAWFLDFKVLPQEAEEENRLLMIRSVTERAVVLPQGPMSEGQFYSPPESLTGSEDEFEEKQNDEKPLL
ncbi:hypothetical protein GDO86_011529 [Hymenochirus boettgeri]|uniref:MENTAL domain-containing protein n=1 Tax=Hymenochirus boettgeri TaxID=247094 RepID=A0A8T2JGY4_9PIPI|nr:hypothetical protein GDO86_011529 [Hymenochirus boettgeri]